MRSVFVLLCLILGISAASAQKQSRAPITEPYVTSGTFEVAFGWVRGPDGKKYSMKGLKLPFTAERIDAKRIRRVSPPRGKQAGHNIALPSAHDLPSYVNNMIHGSLLASLGGGAMMSTTVYDADSGQPYGVIGDFFNPSVLDDHTMSGGAGQLWENLTFGVDMTESMIFIIRWRLYRDYVTGRGHDAMAFDNEFADFGVILAQDPPFNTQPYPVGVHKFIINVQPQPPFFPGVVSPTNTFYMAQQHRTTEPNGEGPAVDPIGNVYNINGAPSVGSSENNFWFDWDPQNFVYAEDEIEILQGAQFSNVLRQITVLGTQETCNPFTHSLFGEYVSGDLVDLWDSDDLYLRFKPRYDVARNDPNAIVTVEGISPVATVTSFQFMSESAASLPGGTQKVQLWNWLTSQWDEVDSRAISSTDTPVGVLITSQMNRYVNSSTRRMRSRILFYGAPNVDRSYAFRVDRTAWVITRP
jgi:hypothetical protein